MDNQENEGKKGKLSEAVNEIADFVRKESATILGALGATGLIGANAMAYLSKGLVNESIITYALGTVCLCSAIIKGKTELDARLVADADACKKEIDARLKIVSDIHQKWISENTGISVEEVNHIIKDAAKTQSRQNHGRYKPTFYQTQYNKQMTLNDKNQELLER